MDDQLANYLRSIQGTLQEIELRLAAIEERLPDPSVGEWAQTILSQGQLTAEVSALFQNQLSPMSADDLRRQRRIEAKAKAKGLPDPS